MTTIPPARITETALTPPDGTPAVPMTPTQIARAAARSLGVPPELLPDVVDGRVLWPEPVSVDVAEAVERAVAK